MSGILDMGANKITNLAAPTANTDAATRVFVTDQAAIVSGLLNDHIIATPGAHDASAITFTPPSTAPQNLWFTAQNVQQALTQVGTQLYAPDEETMEAMIAAANALAGGTDQEFTNPDLFASDIIVTRHMLAGSINASVLDATTIRAQLVSANDLYSNNYSYVSGNHSTAGTFFDLTNGDIVSEQFSIVNGNLYITGSATIGGSAASDLATSGDVSAAEASAKCGSTGSSRRRRSSSDCRSRDIHRRSVRSG